VSQSQHLFFLYILSQAKFFDLDYNLLLIGWQSYGGTKTSSHHFSPDPAYPNRGRYRWLNNRTFRFVHNFYIPTTSRNQTNDLSDCFFGFRNRQRRKDMVHFWIFVVIDNDTFLFSSISKLSRIS